MRSWSIFGGRFFGVEFRVHVTFAFLLAYLLLTPFRNGETTGALQHGLALSGLVLLSVFLHEVGHVLVGARNGLAIKASILLPLGGIALQDTNRPERLLAAK